MTVTSLDSSDCSARLSITGEAETRAPTSKPAKKFALMMAKVYRNPTTNYEPQTARLRILESRAEEVLMERMNEEEQKEKSTRINRIIEALDKLLEEKKVETKALCRYLILTSQELRGEVIR